mgnify:CR=1 FL=1
MTAPTVVRTSPDGAVHRSQGVFSGTYTAATDAYDSGGIALASGVITISLGFVPSYFKIVNVTDRITQEWYSGMNLGDFFETVAAGTRTLETDDQVVVTVSNTGTAPVTIKPVATVTITAAGGAMTDNDTVVWIAEG